MKKLMLLWCTCSMILSACAFGNTKYERSSKAGILIPITLETTLERLEKGDTFVLLISQTTCGACKRLKEVLDVYLSNHEVMIHELVLDQYVNSQEEFNHASEQLNQYVNDFRGTPALYYIKDGKSVGEVIGYDSERGIEPYDNFVQKFQLDAVKEAS